MILGEPYEFVDVPPGGSFSMRVTAYQDGSAVIHPRNPSPRHIRQFMEQSGISAPPVSGTPIAVEVQVLRLFGDRLDEPSPMHYFDFSSKTLRADLLARLAAGLVLPFNLSLSANGHAPKKRYSVSVF